ncbi:MAG TPA: serine/threonine-protein kinase [Planctomycetota bacterium]|nr:serine/threonine-protein kinase [Planctomycetota bacterium]
MTEPGRPAPDVGLGDLIIREGIAPFDKVHECLEIQKRERSEKGSSRKLGEILVERGYISETQLGGVLEKQARTREEDTPQIPGYLLYERIGRGAMGTIYRAKQISVGRVVAIKVLPPELGTDIAFVQRFLREARSVANLSHPNIVAGIDAGEADGVHYYVMEYVDGTNAFELVKRHRRLLEPECVRIGLQISRALDHAHRHGIVHRDIKPHNIIVTPDGTAKLCDLGLAKRTIGSDPSITAEGMAIGTPTYIAPEIALGERLYDIRSDIYSLGVTLYHLATGNPPFLGVLAADVLRKHVSEPPVPPKDMVTDLGDAFNAVILKMLTKKREERYQTPADLIQALQGIDAATVEPPTASRGHKVTTRRKVTERKVTERRITERSLHIPHSRRHQHGKPGPGTGTGIMLGAGAGVAFLAIFFMFLTSSGGRTPRPPSPQRPTPLDSAVEPPPSTTAPIESQNERHERRLRELTAMRDSRPMAETYEWLSQRQSEFKGSGLEVLWAREKDRFVESANERADSAWTEHLAKVEAARQTQNLTQTLQVLQAFPESARVLHRTESTTLRTRAGEAYEKLWGELAAKRDSLLAPTYDAFEAALTARDYDRALAQTDLLVQHVLSSDDAHRVSEMRRRVFNTAFEDVLRPPIRPGRLEEGRKTLVRLFKRYEFDPQTQLEKQGVLERLEAQHAYAVNEAADRLSAEYSRIIRGRVDALLAARRFWEARGLFADLLDPRAASPMQTALYAPGFDDASLLARLRSPRLLSGRDYSEAVTEAEAGIAAARSRPQYETLAKILLDVRALWLIEWICVRAADGLEKAGQADWKNLKSAAFRGAKVSRVERLPIDPPDRLLAFRVHTAPGTPPQEIAIAPAQAVSPADVVLLARLSRDPAGDDLLDLQGFLLHVFSPERDAGMMDQLEARLKEERHSLGWDHYTERLAAIKAAQPKGPVPAPAPPLPAAGPEPKDPESPAALFAVTPVPLDGERFRLTYTFAQDKQMEDFRAPRWKVGAPPLEMAKAPSGAVQLEGTGLLFWKATGRGEGVFEMEFDVALCKGTLGLMMHGSSRDQGVIAFAGCVEGKYQGRTPEGLMAICRMPLDNWEDPLRESKRISPEPVKAPLDAGSRYVMRLSYTAAANKYEVSLTRVGAKPVTIAAELKTRGWDRGSVGLWLSEMKITVRRIVIEAALDPQWVKKEARKPDKD